MSVYRWVGVPGYVNKPTFDRRTLALGDRDEVIRHIKRGDPLCPTEDLEHRPLPLRLHSTLNGCPGVVGEIDTIRLSTTCGLIRASGTIDIPDGPDDSSWSAPLLRGEGIPLGLDVTEGSTSGFRIHWWQPAGIRALLSRRRYLIGEHMILSDWRITGATLQPEAAWLIASLELSSQHSHLWTLTTEGS